MKAYIVAEIAIKDPVTYERYKAMAPASIAKYGGKYVVRGATTTKLEGDWDPPRFVMLEFPDGETARKWWNSPEYAPAKAIRQSCSTAKMLLVEGPPFDPSA
jgi:uncharacterized protein (DUF1330 family)